MTTRRPSDLLRETRALLVKQRDALEKAISDIDEDIVKLDHIQEKYKDVFVGGHTKEQNGDERG